MNKERDQTFFFFTLVSEKLLIKSRILLRIKRSKNLTSNKDSLKSRIPKPKKLAST